MDDLVCYRMYRLSLLVVRIMAKHCPVADDRSPKNKMRSYGAAIPGLGWLRLPERCWEYDEYVIILDDEAPAGAVRLW